MHAADTVLWLPGDGRLVQADPSSVLAQADVVPPLSALARELALPRVPLSVRQARRTIGPQPGLSATSTPTEAMTWASDGSHDVLLATSIVESGLDIPRANTMVVWRADMFGLAALYQLRGRVGRSRERAYAYFLYPKDKTLTETSYDRLATIAQNNDLGSGIAVAQKDLEMRGAGNVLGAEQSGHIAGVGFDMYVRLVSEAVETFKGLMSGEPIDATDKGPKEIRVDLPVDAHIPESYINSERLRLEVYRKLAEARDDDALTAALDDQAGEPARNGTDDDGDDEAHCSSFCRLRAGHTGPPDVGGTLISKGGSGLPGT